MLPARQALPTTSGLSGFREVSGAELESIRRKKSSSVYVLSKSGRPLMPCSPGRAKRLLKEGKAKVERRTPFTIRLTRPSGETVQPVVLGAGSGYSGAGISAVAEGKEPGALWACGEVELRSDMVELISGRRQYRRGRRHRKTWHRKPRFLNRKKTEGWLAPSVRDRLDSHLKAIEKVKGLIPVSEIRVEVADFDIQRIKEPAISGEGHQNGPQKDFWNVREYVLFMTAVKRMLLHELKARGYEAKETYGYITKSGRIAPGLPKFHANDAFVIAGGGKDCVRAESLYCMRRVRKCNRKLYMGSRSHIRNTGARFIKGFQRFDRVLWEGERADILTSGSLTEENSAHQQTLNQ